MTLRTAFYPATLEVFLNGSSQGLFSATAPSLSAATRSARSFEFLASGAATVRIQRAAGGVDQYVGFDNLSLNLVTSGSAVPEPSSVEMVVVDMAAIAAAQRRKR